MTAIHKSRNLTIEYEPDCQSLVVTVTFHDESIVGVAEAACPKCGGKPSVSLWELEGPGSDVNTIWMVCGEANQCTIDNEPLRWAVAVDFERDWEDI